MSLQSKRMRSRQRKNEAKQLKIRIWTIEIRHVLYLGPCVHFIHISLSSTTWEMFILCRKCKCLPSGRDKKFPVTFTWLWIYGCNCIACVYLCVDLFSMEVLNTTKWNSINKWTFVASTEYNHCPNSNIYQRGLSGDLGK